MKAERGIPHGQEELRTSAESKEKSAEQAEAGKEHGVEERPLSRFEKVTAKIKEFWATQVKGEVREEHEEESESVKDTAIKVAKAGVPAVTGAVASLLGVKSLIDVPRYLSQKYFTEQEKRGLMEAFEGAGKAQQERPEGAAIEHDLADAAREQVGSRTSEIRAKIEGSKYMTADKKAELLKRVEEIESKHNGAVGEAEGTRSKDFAAAINESIETRVKGTTALKETLNTMAVASGLSAARALVFGSVSLYERYQKVSEERESGERKGSQFNEMVVGGIKETFKALTFREGHSTGEKIRNAAEALASVMRFGGMAAVGLNELNQEGISGAISKAIEGLKHEKVTEFVSKNFAENAHHLLSFVGLAKHHGEAGAAAGHGAEAAAGHGAAAAAEHGGAAAEHAEEAAKHAARAAEHAGRAVAGGLLSEEAVKAVQEGLHLGETHLEVGAEVHHEASGGEHE